MPWHKTLTIIFVWDEVHLGELLQKFIEGISIHISYMSNAYNDDISILYNRSSIIKAL